MASAVLPPLRIVAPQFSDPPPGAIPWRAEEPLRQAAAAGQFRAIALWLNQALTPHHLYAQVQEDRPGCLRVRVEYERPWPADTLARLVCHHLWRLQSPVIEGIHLMVAPVGQRGCTWERRIRLKPAPPQGSQSRRSAMAKGRSQTFSPSPSRRPPRPLPPPMGRRSRPAPPHPGRSLGPAPQAGGRPAPPPGPLTATTKTFRALMLTGSAVTAFLMGCWVEVIWHQQDAPPTVVSQATTHSPAQPLVTSGGQGLPVAYTRQGGGGQSWAQRPRVIQGALEPLMVISHAPRQPGDTVTLVFGGQVDFSTLPTSVLQNPEPLLGAVSAYQGADLAMVSLNTSLATAATSLQENYLDRQRPQVAAQLHHNGVDVVDLATEGSLTFGAQGLGETLQVLDRQGLYRVGAGRTEVEARRPEVIEVKGQRIAYLSYSQRDLLRAQGQRAGVNSWTQDSLRADVAALRSQVDWVVVNYRWKDGEDPAAAGPGEPSEWQRTAAHLAIEAGADVVIGHHPQGLQGAELYQGRPIVYSLGALVGGNSPSKPEQAGVLLQITLAPQQLQVELLPVAVRQGRPYQVDGPEATEILQTLQAASQAFPQPMASTWTVALEPPAPVATPARASYPPQALTSPPQSPTDRSLSPAPVPVATPAVDYPAPEDFPTPALDSSPVPVPEPLLLPEAPRLDNWGPKLTEEEEAFFPIPAGETAPAPGPMVAPPGEIPAASPASSAGFVAPASGEPLEFTPESIPVFTPPPAYTPPEARALPADDPVMDVRSRLGRPQTRVFHPQTAPQEAEPAATTL